MPKIDVHPSCSECLQTWCSGQFAPADHDDAYHNSIGCLVLAIE